jgi:hypothetical protein
LTGVQTLADLLNSAEGLTFLESEGVYVEQQAFKDHLRRPAKTNLADEFHTDDRYLVCSGQQVYVDYQQSVLSKIEVLQDMEGEKDLYPFFLWVDTDRSGSDNLVTKMAWPGPSKKGPITILPPGTREVETRFAAIDSAQLSSAIARLETFLRQSGEKKEGAKDKFLQLRAFFTNGQAETLSEFNLRLTDFLLTQVLGFTPRSVTLSGLLDREYILDEVNLFVNRVGDVVGVLNEAIGSLAEKGIDPQVTPLDEGYLPLFYSCDVDDTRLRLYHYVDGNEHFAVGACKCGQDYRFYLGRDTLSMAAIAETNRWSPDVCFPIFFNDLVSGFVAGKSSAIYLIVLNKALRQVLDKTPVPILVPKSLGVNGSESPKIDSLIYRYFAG